MIIKKVKFFVKEVNLEFYADEKLLYKTDYRKLNCWFGKICRNYMGMSVLNFIDLYVQKLEKCGFCNKYVSKYLFKVKIAEGNIIQITDISLTKFRIYV